MPRNRSSSLVNQQRFLRTVNHDRIRLLNYVPRFLRTAAVNLSSAESYRFPRVCYQGSEKGQSFTLLFKCCCNMLVECDCLLMSVHLLCTAITPSEKAAVILQPASAPALRNKMFWEGLVDVSAQAEHVISFICHCGTPFRLKFASNLFEDLSTRKSYLSTNNAFLGCGAVYTHYIDVKRHWKLTAGEVQILAIPDVFSRPSEIDCFF